MDSVHSLMKIEDVELWRLQAIKGVVPIRSGKITFPLIKEKLYEWKRQQIRMISFADSNRAFLNKERYYQQRFHAFDNEDIKVKDYLLEQGYEENNTAHISLIKKCGIHKLFNLSRVKLSSGQTRKLLTTVALFSKPQLLLIDNPYVGLDRKNRKLFNELMDEITDQFNIQLILSGHFDELPHCVTKIFHLSPEGRHFEKSATEYSTSIASIPPLSSSVVKYFEEVDHWPLFKNTILLRDITIRYEDSLILNNLNWQVKKGEKWAMLGDNGSGKSTLICLIAADHPQAYSNQIQLFDRPRSRRDSIWDIKEKIGFVSSEFHAYFHDPRHSCQAIVQQGLFETIYNNRAITSLETEVIQELFNYFNIGHLMLEAFNHCSTGEQRLVLFLRSIIKNPPLLLLDEPFQGLDKNNITRAIKLLETVLKDEHSLVFITHFESEIPKIVSHRLELQDKES